MNPAVSSAIGATLIVAGAVSAWGAGHLWHALSDQEHGKTWWKALVVFLALVAGLGIGGGASLVIYLSFFYVKLGFVPLWAFLAAGFGIWFLVDLAKRHGPTRTPILGFLTATMIALAVTPPALGAATNSHRQAPQVTTFIQNHRG